MLGSDWINSFLPLSLFLIHYRFFECSMPSSVLLGDPMGQLSEMLSLQSDPVNLPVSEASTSSSVSSLSAAAPVQSSPPDAVEVFYNNIVKSRGVGIQSSCFSYDSNVLVHLTELHGINCS